MGLVVAEKLRDTQEAKPKEGVNPKQRVNPKEEAQNNFELLFQDQATSGKASGWLFHF